MTSGGESERLFEAYSIPPPARPLFQTAFGNLNPRAPPRWTPRIPIAVRCFRSPVDVATQLHLSPHTLKTHVRNAFAKLGITSRAQLAQLMRGGD
jgi:hypothetical protein